MRKSTLLLSLLAAGACCAQTLPSYKDLKFPPLRPVKIPEPIVYSLPNGLRVFLLEDHELPLISGVALVRTGNLFDPDDKRGLAGITGTVLRAGGTKAKTGDQIDTELENVAASVESGIGESSGSLSFSALRESIDPVLAIFKDLLTAPEFRQDKIDLAKTQVRSGISRRNDEAGGIAAREFDDIVYGRDTPYGWDVNYEHIDRIQRDDLIQFYRRYYFPANVMLALHGDFNTAEMKAKLEKLFVDWNYSQPPVPAFPKVQAKAQPGIFEATKTDVTQTFLQIGHLGGVLSDKDFPALEVAGDILGGGFSSRLLQRVRTKLGYAYEIEADWGAAYDHPGLFQITGSTQSKYTVPAIKAIREELDRMRTEEVTDQELQTAKDKVLNGFVFFFDRPSKTLNRLLTYAYYGYPKDFIFGYQKAVAAVTKADVLRVCNEYFRPRDLTIVAVGNPKDYLTPLSSLGMPEQTIDLTIPEPKAAAAKSDSASLEKGKALLGRMQEALGGTAKLEAVKDSEYLADIEVEAGGAAMKVKQRNMFVAPSSFRQEIELPVGKVVTYSNGQSGWISSPQGVQAMPEPVLKQVRGELFRDFFSLLLSDRDPGRTVNAISDSQVDIANKDGESVRLTLDDKTGLPAKMTYQETGMSGPTGIEESFGDWREVHGVRVPFAVTITQGGKKYANALVQEYKINSGLTLEGISKKP